MKGNLRKIFYLMIAMVMVFLLVGCAENYQGYKDISKAETCDMQNMPTRGCFTFDLSGNFAGVCSGESELTEYDDVLFVDNDSDAGFSKINDNSLITLTVPDKEGAWVKLQKKDSEDDYIDCVLSVEGFTLGDSIDNSSIQMMVHYSGLKPDTTYNITMGGYLGVYDESRQLICLVILKEAAMTNPFVPVTHALKTAVHEHDWKYSLARTDTIKVYCANDGHEGDDLTLTLLASSENYSGSAATITVGTAEEKTAWENAGFTVPTDISYEKADGTALTEAPTAFGSYVAKVSPVGETASEANTAKVSFTIEKNEEERLADAKDEAKAAIDTAVGTDSSENVKKAADDAKKAIDDAKTVDEAATAKNAGIEAIKAAKKANADEEAAAKAKELAEAKEAAKNAIDDELGADSSENVKKAADDAKKAIDDAKTVDEAAAAKNAGIEAIRAAKAANVTATSYDTLITREYAIGKGDKKGITIGNMSQSCTSPLNGVVTVNAKLKVTIAGTKWTPTGYVHSRVTSKNPASAQWISIENDKDAMKEFKKLANVQFDKKQNQTIISTKQNKKIDGGVYAIRLSDGNGNTVYMNIECIEINKSNKKSLLAVSNLDAVPSVDTILSAADSNTAKTIGFTLNGSDTRSDFNSNAVEWTVGSGKKAVILKKGEVTAYNSSTGNAIAYLTVADDGTVKVLSGKAKGVVKLTGQVNMKKYSASVTVKA